MWQLQMICKRSVNKEKNRKVEAQLAWLNTEFPKLAAEAAH